MSASVIAQLGLPRLSDLLKDMNKNLLLMLFVMAASSAKHHTRKQAACGANSNLFLDDHLCVTVEAF